MKRKFKRGDPHPTKPGLLFWAYQIAKGVWLTKEKLEKRRSDCNRLARKYALQDRNKRNERLRKYYSNNPEAREKRAIRRKRWMTANPKKWAKFQLKYVTKKRAINPAFRLRGVMQCRLRAALNAKSLKKTSKTFKLVGCTPQFLRQYLESRFTAGMSWEKKGQIHIDHKTPLASAKNRKELIKLFHYKNLQPLWAKDNLHKSDKIL